MVVLLIIGSEAVTVLEINTEVFYGLDKELFSNFAINLTGSPAICSISLKCKPNTWSLPGNHLMLILWYGMSCRKYRPPRPTT